MLCDKRISVIVPAYNEEKLVGRTLRRMPGFVDSIIVVDDASTDRTRAQIASVGDPRLQMVTHRKNRGVGAAVATGCKRALSSGTDVTVVMAADGQMHPADLVALLTPILRDEADYAKGNRLDAAIPRGAMPWHRWVGNHLLSWATRWATGTAICDSQCGYTAINRRAKLALDWDDLWTRYGYPNDLLSRLTSLGLRVEDVPVRPVYGEEESGLTAFDALAVVPFVIVRAWLRDRVRRNLLSRPRWRPT